MKDMQFGKAVFCSLYFICVTGGCDLKNEHNSTSREGISLQAEERVYPVDPRVHVDLPGTNPLDPATFPRNISNAFAYSRYALGLAINSQAILDATTNVELVMGLNTVLAASPISPEWISGTYKTALSEVEKSEASTKVKNLFAGSLLEGNFSERSFLFAKRLARCTSETGASLKQCCDGFLTPMLLFTDDAIPPSYSLAKEASKVDLSVILKDGDTNPAFFKHAGARVWLSQCNYPATVFPKDLKEFKVQYGDFKKWGRDFHPFSMAKQGPRRVYRKSMPAVSVAETLNENCEISETEVVIQGLTGKTIFGVYDLKGQSIEFSEFPIANGDRSIRLVPDSCLGCHFKLDTRKFNVRIPSYVGLGLGVMEQHRIKIQGDPAACARPGETIIWDKP